MTSATPAHRFEYDVRTLRALLGCRKSSRAVGVSCAAASSPFDRYGTTRGDVGRARRFSAYWAADGTFDVSFDGGWRGVLAGVTSFSLSDDVFLRHTQNMMPKATAARHPARPMRPTAQESDVRRGVENGEGDLSMI